MLSARLVANVRKRVAGFWNDAARLREVAALAEGKESGHRIADYVDEKTTSFVHAHFTAAFERDKKGAITQRSMGDLWLKEKGIYHPVNIKTGLLNTGRPNMVALRKLLGCFLQNRIDSYYLLMIKFVSRQEGKGAPKVYFVDMLDCLDYLAFDSGPGQIMLKSDAFFADFESRSVVSRTPPEKADMLLRMLQDGDKRLFAARKQKQNDLRKMTDLYKRRKIFAVSPADQEVFNLGT